MGYEVRPATRADAAGIATVHVASWQAAYRGLLPDELLDSLSAANRREQWSTILAETKHRVETLVATHEHRVVGFAGLGPQRCDNCGADDGELYAIYMHPDHWSKGVGYQLHTAAIHRLRDLSFASATLWVLDGNLRAIAFYSRTGWHDTGKTRVDVRPDGSERFERQLHRQLTATDV